MAQKLYKLKPVKELFKPSQNLETVTSQYYGMSKSKNLNSSQLQAKSDDSNPQQDSPEADDTSQRNRSEQVRQSQRNQLNTQSQLIMQLKPEIDSSSIKRMTLTSQNNQKQMQTIKSHRAIAPQKNKLPSIFSQNHSESMSQLMRRGQSTQLSQRMSSPYKRNLQASESVYMEQNNPNMSSIQMSATATEFKNEFLAKQKLRYQKEQEVQLMINRIALLEQEDEKIKKKIDLTKKKAEEIMLNKQLNDQKQRERLKIEQEREQQLEEIRTRNLQMKEQMKIDLSVRQKELQERLIAEARHRKKMRKENDKKIRQDQMQFLHENQQRAGAVKRQEIEIKEKLEKYRIKRENMSKGQLDQRVEMENQKVLQADLKLKQLELREQAIIEKLKNTQMTESKAKQLLVDAIIATSQGKKARVQQTESMSQLAISKNGLHTASDSLQVFKSRLILFSLVPLTSLVEPLFEHLLMLLSKFTGPTGLSSQQIKKLVKIIMMIK